MQTEQSGEQSQHQAGDESIASANVHVGLEKSSLYCQPLQVHELLRQKHLGKMVSLEEEVYQHLRVDPERVQGLGECNTLRDFHEPEEQLDMAELQLKEFREVIHKASAIAAPGPCGN